MGLNQAVDVKIDARRYRALLARAPKAFTKALNTSADLIGEDFEKRFKKDRLSGRPGVNDRSGQLKSDFRYRLKRTKGIQQVYFSFANNRYARIQEHGGTIIPVRREWLTIPVGPALDSRGVSKGRARRFPGLQFIKINEQTALLVAKQKPSTFGIRRSGRFYKILKRVGKKTGFLKAKTKVGKVYFVLKKSVFVPARMGFRKYIASYFAPNGRAKKIILKETAKAAKALEKGGQ